MFIFVFEKKRPLLLAKGVHWEATIKYNVYAAMYTYKWTYWYLHGALNKFHWKNLCRLIYISVTIYGICLGACMCNVHSKIAKKRTFKQTLPTQRLISWLGNLRKLIHMVNWCALSTLNVPLCISYLQRRWIHTNINRAGCLLSDGLLPHRPFLCVLDWYNHVGADWTTWLCLGRRRRVEMRRTWVQL